VPGELRVDLDLERVDGLQEEPRERGDEQPDERREHEQRAVLPTAHERRGIDREGRGIGRHGETLNGKRLPVRGMRSRTTGTR